MTLGEVIDLIRQVEQAEAEVEQAEVVLGHGGNAATMQGKTEIFQDAKRYLKHLRDEEFPFAPLELIS